MPLKWCGVGISVTRTWTSTYISERSRCMKNLYTVLFFLPGIGFVCRPLLQTYKALFVQIHIFDITTVWGSEVSGIYINFIPWGHTQQLSLYFCFIVEILIIFAQIQQCFLYTVQLHYYVSNFQYSCKGIWWLGIPHIISQILARIGGTVGHNIDRWITVLSLVSMQPG